MFQIQFYEDYFQEWMPATTGLYETRTEAEDDMKILKGKVESTDRFRIRKLSKEDLR